MKPIKVTECASPRPWLPADSGWCLQENRNLSTTNWVNSSSGTNNPITVPAALPTKFYRLFKP